MELERLWTPWRRAFIEGATNAQHTGCFLCAIAADPATDKEHFVLARSTFVFVLLNLYPYNTGHLMVAPYEHTGDLARLDRSTAADLMPSAMLGIVLIASFAILCHLGVVVWLSWTSGSP